MGYMKRLKNGPPVSEQVEPVDHVAESALADEELDAHLLEHALDENHPDRDNNRREGAE